jgi:NitT/TauT family transport system substrate-binding protein
VKRRQFLSLCGLAPLAGCSRRRSSATPIRVSVGPYLYLAPLYLANELGYFKDAGLTVELHQTPSGSQAIPLLAGGQLDVSFSALTPALANAVARGADVRVVAAQDYTTFLCPGISQLVVRRSSYPHGLPSVGQLKGKRIAILNRAGFAEFSLDQILAHNGMSASDVEISILRPLEALGALSSGKVDAVVTPDHFGKNPAAVSSDAVAITGLTEVLPGLAYTYVMFGQRMLQGDVGAGARFLSAQLRGVSEFLKGRIPRFMDDFARSNGLDPSDARQFCRDTPSADGAIDLKSIQIFVDWAVRKGYCSKPVAAEQLVDRRFLNGARELASSST